MFPAPFNRFCSTLIVAIGEAGSYDFARVRVFLDNNKINPLAEFPPSSSEKNGDDFGISLSAAFASILGSAMLMMGGSGQDEDLVSDMAFRIFGQVLHFATDPSVRRSVPLALALLSVSNPKLSFMDTLLKFSHDSDQDVLINSVVALGLIGAGTNNARLASLLRSLHHFHHSNPTAQIAIRFAHGLVHLGKGLISLTPLQFDRQLISPNAFVGLTTFAIALADPKSIFTNRRFMTLMLALAAQPRMLMIKEIVPNDEDYDIEDLVLPVRVGQAVDVVGQAGQPRTITGFQTYKTPVLLAYGERAELATSSEKEDYNVLSPILEGVILVSKKQTNKNSQ